MDKIVRKAFTIFLSVTMALTTVSAIVSATETEYSQKMVINSVTVHPVTEEVEKSEESTEIPESFEYHFDSYPEDLDKWNLFGWSISRTYGYLWIRSTGMQTPGCYRYIDNFGDDFIFETRLMFAQWGQYSGISFEMEDRALVIRMRPHDLFVSSSAGTYYADEIDFSDTTTWYDVRIETYNYKERARIFLNGACIADVETMKRVSNEPKIQYFVTSTPSDASETRVDWMKFTPITYDNDLAVSGIKSNGCYKEGEEIQVKANFENSMDIPEVTYRLNGQVAAIGKAPEYRATFQNLPAGTYEMTAEYGDMRSQGVPFVVSVSKSPEIKINQTSDGMRVSFSGAENVSRIEYLLDGVSIAKEEKTPYTANITTTAESHTVTALAYDSSGKLIQETSTQWAPEFTSDPVSVNYANEITYSVAGTDGEANVTFGNGNHLVQMKHSARGVTYFTQDGEKTYSSGLGQFTVLTDGPFAEVYRNGQLVFAYLMPMTDSVECYAEENGMNVSDISLSVPEGRRNYFVNRNVDVQNAVYTLSGVNLQNNLDFVADTNDSVELALNDGYYTSKISLENGVFYGWTVFEEKSMPEKREIASAVSGNAYYRLEMSGGMVRLYANGKWIASFRGVLSVGSPQIGVNVKAGILDYLAVSGCSDLYLYRDEFSNTGDFDSLDYWRLTNLNAEVDSGSMILDAARKTDGIAELNAYAGNLDFSAEVELSRCRGGFWFILNHSIQEEYTKMGYNAITGRFEVVDVSGKEKNLIPVVRNEVEGKLPLNKKVKMELKLRDTDLGKKVSLIVDGKTVLVHETAELDSQVLARGKVGFMLSDSVAEVFSVSYRGDAKPLLSVNENNPVPFNASTYDLIENEDGIVMVGDIGYLYSKDGGASWRLKSSDELQGCDIVELANGEILSVKMLKEEQTVQFVSAISTDGGRSYTQVGTINEPQGWVTTTGNRVCQGASGRVYFLGALPDTENDGAVVVYYSDDNGRNWNVGQTIDYLDMGCSVLEPKMLELENGHCRMWVRTDLGAVAYIDSYDYGVTWDETPRMTPMFSASNCFNVDQDLNHRNILYMGWPYDNANLGGMIQYPRTRWAIARSEDWGESWEFIGTTFEYTRDESTVQNMGINVTNEYIVHNANGIADSTNEYGGRYLVLNRDKQVATQRFEQLHLRYPTQIDGQAVVSPEQKAETIVVNLESGDAVVGNRFSKDGGISAGVLLDFNSGSFTPDGDFLVGDGMTYDKINGMTLNGGQLRYIPTENYNPILPKERYVCFTAKIPDESSMLEVIFQSPEGNGGRGSFRISADGFGEGFFYNESYNCGFVAGTQWVDYKLVADSTGTASLYMRSKLLTENKWVLAVRGSGYAFDNSPSTGLYFAGQGSVRDAVIYGDTSEKRPLPGVALTDVASMTGASITVQEEEGILFCLTDEKTPFEVLERNGKQYIDLHAFSEHCGMKLVRDGELMIAGESEFWCERAIRAFRLATNLLTNEMP